MALRYPIIKSPSPAKFTKEIDYGTKESLPQEQQIVLCVVNGTFFFVWVYYQYTMIAVL